MAETAVRAQGLGKTYRLGTRPAYGRLTESVFEALRVPFRRRRRPATDGFWALRDVSFEIERGEVVGILGRNGAGKTTLLKVLSRITEPSEGLAEIDGRIGTLLEVGTGFHPELTGRENVYLNGAILGMNKREIDRRFDQIVSFAEIERFLDTPVKRYSSGMYVRLAFSVAAHLEPDILIVDEVLAVGDVSFQRKCLERMDDVAQEGRTVLFVSHNMSSIQRLCTRGVWLDEGRIRMDDQVGKVVTEYLAEVSERTAGGRALFEPDPTKPAAITGVRVTGPTSEMVRIGGRLVVEVDYQCSRELRNVQFLIGVYDMSHVGLFLLDSDTVGNVDLAHPNGRVRCDAGPIPLTSGSCFVNVALMHGGELLDYVPEALSFDISPIVDPDYGYVGPVPQRSWVMCVVPQRWKVADLDAGL